MINQIGLEKWALLFFIYGFFGWIFESLVCSFNQKKWINRGFLRGPIIPIYGFGAISILITVLPFSNNVFEVFFLGMIVTTILEYFVGVAMEKIFKVRYWDYSHEKFNFQGHICLQSSIAWGILSCVLAFFIHGNVLKVFTILNSRTIDILFGFLIGIFIVDFFESIKIAFNLNKILEEISEARNKFNNLSNQLKELVVNEKIDLMNKYSLKSQNELKIYLEASLEETKMRIDRIYRRLNFLDKDFVNSHYSAVSIKFNEALNELKSRINNKL